MRERKVWNEQEDRILRYLREEREEKKWSVIARKMEEEFNIRGRTGKQCRERYHNHLHAEIIRTEWTEGEDDLLYTLHEEYGNKWSSIAQKLPGRSDNCVKNHFYSKLRKSVRRLNKFITDHLHKEYDQISPRLLSKIIEYSESRFKSTARVEQQTIDYSIHLKNRLYKFENGCDQMENEEDIDIARELIDDIFFFEKNNKKPGKLIRNRVNYSLDNQKQFLHPKTCVRGNRSNSNLSDASDLSEDQSGSSSYGQSYEQQEVIKPRNRSLTTTRRSSKDLSSNNTSQIMEVKLQTRSNNKDKSQTEEEPYQKMVDFQMPIMDLDKLSISQIEDHSFSSMDKSEKPSRRASIESRNSKSSENKSSGSNRNLRTTFDAFCQLDDKMGFNWPNDYNKDPINEGNDIIWRIIQPKEPTKTDLPLDEDEPIQIDSIMDEQF